MSALLSFLYAIISFEVAIFVAVSRSAVIYETDFGWVSPAPGDVTQLPVSWVKEVVRCRTWVSTARGTWVRPTEDEPTEDG